MRKLLLLSILYISTLLNAQAQQKKEFAFKNQWIDSVYNQMNDDQRIGQLFMVAAYSGGENKNEAVIDKLISAGKVGGLIFMQGTAEEQVKLTNKYQRNSSTKLFIAMDGEWGLGMRLTGVKDYPKQMSIGATNDSLLMYNMGVAIAKQCKRIGVHINFAPTVDINNNPLNPVINFRSFGGNRELVSKMGIAYMKGLQSNGIMACAKHFPGHGDVTVDSHEDLPIIDKSKEALTALELYPFQQLINAGVQGVMVGHLMVKSLDTKNDVPATVSKTIVTEVLKNQMNFNGLIFTDALNMKGLTKSYDKGEADLKALIAGNDILLFSEDVNLAIEKIKFAILSKELDKATIEKKVKKILSYKYDYGLHNFKSLDEKNATNDLNIHVDSFLKVTARASATLVRDGNGLINKTKKNKGSFYYVAINAKESTIQELKSLYGNTQVINITKGMTSAQIKTITDNIAKKSAVVIGIHNLNRYPGKDNNYGLDSQQVQFLKKHSEMSNVMYNVMGTPYITHLFEKCKSLFIGYEDNNYTNMAAYAVVKAQYKASGKLPVSIQFPKKTSKI